MRLPRPARSVPSRRGGAINFAIRNGRVGCRRSGKSRNPVGAGERINCRGYRIPDAGWHRNDKNGQRAMMDHKLTIGTKPRPARVESARRRAAFSARDGDIIGPYFATIGGDAMVAVLSYRDDL